MYPILSFQLPLLPHFQDEDAVQALVTWATRSEHYDFKDDDRQELLSMQRVSRTYGNIVGKEAILHFRRLVKDDVHYVGMCLERPDETGNLLWRAECIFRKAEADLCGAFHIALSRAPLYAGDSSDLSDVPRIPYIAKQLMRNKQLTGETSGPASSLSPPERFPVVICGSDNWPDEGGELIRQLKNKLGPTAQVVTCNTASRSAWVEEGKVSLPAPGDILLIYPAARVERTYHGAIQPGMEQGTVCGEVVRQVHGDAMRWVAEVHAGTVFFWKDLPEGEELPAPAAQKSYCIMNSLMGEYLRRLRRQRGMSQKDLANAAGTSGLIISRLENVRMQRVSRKILSDIEHVLGVEEGEISSLQECAAPPPEPQQTDGVEAAEQVPEKDGFCRRCGLHLYQDSFFCPRCGTKVLR